MSNIQLTINGRAISVPEGSIVAVAIMQAGENSFRHSVTGEPRAMLCGMGICFECRVTINDQAHCLSCQRLCEEGMSVVTT